MLFRTSLSLALLLTAAPVFAQDTAPAAPAVVQTEPRETIEGQLSQERTVIAVPAFATPSVTTVAGLRTDSLGPQLDDVIPAALERRRRCRSEEPRLRKACASP